MTAPYNRKPKKPKSPWMVDCETLSLKRHAAVIDVAVVSMTNPAERKRWLINPDSYKPDDFFHINAETVAFHANNNSGLVEQCRAVGHSWQQVANEINDYFQLHQATEIHIWSQGKDFDSPIIDNLMEQAGYKTPWKYSNFHCLRDLAQMYPEVKRTSFGNHTAMMDVVAQIKHLSDLCAYDDRVYRHVFGGD